MVQILNGIWKPEAQPFEIRTNGCHCVQNHLRSIQKCLDFECWMAKTGPFEIWPSKIPDFKCFRIWDPHCTKISTLKSGFDTLLENRTRKLIINHILNYSGDANADMSKYLNGPNPFFDIWSGFQMSFENQIAQPFENRPKLPPFWMLGFQMVRTIVVAPPFKNRIFYTVIIVLLGD